MNKSIKPAFGRQAMIKMMSMNSLINLKAKNHDNPVISGIMVQTLCRQSLRTAINNIDLVKH